MEKGDIFILTHAVIWSIFPILSKYINRFVSPLLTASLSMGIAALFFAAIITFKKEWGFIKERSAWKYLLLATLLIGIIFYSMIFIGLKFTSAGNSSLISMMQVFYAYIILGSWGKEKITKQTLLGGILMVIGAAIILMPSYGSFNPGDIIILVANAVPVMGNYYMQKARKKVSSTAIMFVRSALSSVFIFGLALIFTSPDPSDVSYALPYLLINGLIMLGFAKILWIEGIHRIPITRANSLSTSVPLFTLFFSYFLIRETPTLFQLGGALPIIIGANIILCEKPKEELVEDEL